MRAAGTESQPSRYQEGSPMTTETPSGAVYPTSPPWATPPPAAGPPPPAGDRGPYTSHGRLLVAYPEEMDRAGRAQPPSWLPVVFWTLVFVLPGAISAARRAGRARDGRNERHPYWLAFASALVADLVLVLCLSATI